MVSAPFQISPEKLLTLADPLIAKVMVHANDRRAARSKMTMVLSEATLQGPPTNIHFLADVISSNRKWSLRMLNRQLLKERKLSLTAIP